MRTTQVWVVVGSVYDEAWVIDSAWENQAAAEARADQMNASKSPQAGYHYYAEAVPLNAPGKWIP